MASPVAPHSGAEFDLWRRWLRENNDQLYISSVTCLEIAYGIATAKRRRPGRRTVALELWLPDILGLFEDRLISITPEIAVLAGEMLARAEATGFAPSSEDAMIAATAQHHGWIVLTHNGKDFRALGGAWRDPLDEKFLRGQ